MIIFISIILGILFILCLWIILRMFGKNNIDTFNLYFGSPGSGKSTFLVHDALNLSKHNIDVYSNIPLSFAKYFDRDYIGKYEFPSNSILFFDEASLNGFDNRDYKTNFKNSNSLFYLKMLRHYKNRIIFYNQGFDELDKKIRTLCNQIWYVKKVGPFSCAVMIRKKVEINKDTHEIVDGYYKPNLFSLIFSRQYIRIIYRRRYYKYFDSYCKFDLGLLPYPCKEADSDAEI